MRRLSFLLAFVPFVAAQLPVSAVARSVLGFDMEAAQSFTRLDGPPFQCGLVIDIDDYGPAKKAGMLLGDTVCGVDGHFYPDMEQIFNYLYSLPRGQEVILRLSHQGKAAINVKASVIDSSELSVTYRTYTDNDIPSLEDRGGTLGNWIFGSTIEVAEVDGTARTIHGNTNPRPIIGSNGQVLIDQGDTIYSINEKFFSGIRSFVAYTHSISPGTPITVRFIRKADGKPYDVNILMPARNAPPAVAATPESRSAQPSPSASTDNGRALVYGALVLGGIAAVGCLIFCGSSKSNSEPEQRPSAMDRYLAKGCHPWAWQLDPYCGPPPTE